MHEIGLGFAYFRHDLRNPAAVLRNVAQGIADVDAAFAHVRPEAVLHDGLAAPHYQVDVQRSSAVWAGTLPAPPMSSTATRSSEQE